MSHGGPWDEGFVRTLEALDELNVVVETAVRSLDDRGFETTASSLVPPLLEGHHFLESQAENGFPVLYEMATIRLWSILESAVNRFVREFLAWHDDSRETAALSKLEGPLIRFAKASPDEQAEFLIERLSAACGAKLKTGVGQFEEMLNAIGQGGLVAPEVKRVLLELAETRHLLVHRGGFVDDRFVNRCQWLEYRSGERLRVDRLTFATFLLACQWYVLELGHRDTMAEWGKDEEFLEFTREHPKEDDAILRVLEGVLKQRHSGQAQRSRNEESTQPAREPEVALASQKPSGDEETITTGS